LDKEPENNNEISGNKLRCINIDCVFNSANDSGHIRNTCNHPNLHVESKFADITIAICSEFRSKKDYSFRKPVTLIDLKSKEKIEISGTPDITATPVEKVTTEELEESLTPEQKEKQQRIDQVADVQPEKPVVVESAPLSSEALTPGEIYNLTDKPGTDFLILKKLYQPNMKRGMVFSVIIHIFALWMLFVFASPNENKDDPTQQQRIVVIEDYETPKFDPPDVDKQKEEEQKEKENADVKDNTKEVRPKITPKSIKPKIYRPKNRTDDTTEITNINNDSLKRAADSLLALKNKLDTTKFQIPDSLRSSYVQDAIGLSISAIPKNWKVTDNRTVDLNKEQFNGVIINTDSASDDPGAVQIFVIIDDPQHSAFNKTIYKNPFRMDDSTLAAFSTDPVTTGSKRISYKFFIYVDNLGKKNLSISSETKKELFDKYKPYIDAIVRSIKIISPPSSDKKDP
jgi:hypothetical protein